MELNSEIKDYWEGEAKVYSRGIPGGTGRTAVRGVEGTDSGLCTTQRLSENSGCGMRSGFFPVILGKRDMR